MKKQTFNFYATPLNFWALTGMMMLAMVVSVLFINFCLLRNMVWIQLCVLSRTRGLLEAINPAEQ